jgi:hypothetical protein
MEYNTHGEHTSRHAQSQRQKNDFTQAFPQAKLKEDIYLRFPAGFEHKNDKWALKLKRKLYGLVQASRNWFLKLSASMKDSASKNKNLIMSFPQERHDHRFIY